MRSRRTSGNGRPAANAGGPSAFLAFESFEFRHALVLSREMD
jgi:hypothetical protein